MKKMDYSLWEPEGEWRTEVVLPSMPGMTEGLTGAIRQSAALITVTGFDWENDLTPWPAEKVFRGGRDFGGDGEAFLKRLTESVLPEAESRLSHPPEKRCLLGVSLAGLFALWAGCRSDCFDGVGSVSGSLWYPGCMDYLMNRLPGKRPAVYLSLGDKEEKTRNPVLSAIGNNTRRLAAATGAMLVMNPGNHFADGVKRLSSAFDELVRLTEIADGKFPF